MKPITDYNEIPEATEKEKLQAGGYVLKIVGATDNTNKDYFEIIYDIAEGTEAGRFSDDWGKEHPYMHRFFRSYSEKAKGMFKAFISAIEKSNNCELASKVVAGTLAPSDIEGKLIGAVIAYEQYDNDRGEIKDRTYIASVMSADRIRNNDYKVPELKTIKGSKSADSNVFASNTADNPFGGFEPLKDEELPF